VRALRLASLEHIASLCDVHGVGLDPDTIAAIRTDIEEG
jgi:hypothetical protein